MRFWASLIYSRWGTSITTRRGPGVDEGRVKGERWEWGIGKGQWKRQAKKAAQVFDMKGRVKTVYFGVGAHYRLEYTGTKSAAELLYNYIR